MVGLWGALGGIIPRARPYPYLVAFHGWGASPLVASANCAHLRVWEVGWGKAPLDLHGVLVGGFRATQLTEARWGLPLVCIANLWMGPL